MKIKAGSRYFQRSLRFDELSSIALLFSSNPGMPMTEFWRYQRVLNGVFPVTKHTA